MKPPFIVNESSSVDVPGDVTFYESASDLEGHLEAIDVENEEFFAFDSEGRLLRLEADGWDVAWDETEVRT